MGKNDFALDKVDEEKKKQLEEAKKNISHDLIEIALGQINKETERRETDEEAYGCSIGGLGGVSQQEKYIDLKDVLRSQSANQKVYTNIGLPYELDQQIEALMHECGLKDKSFAIEMMLKYLFGYK